MHTLLPVSRSEGPECIPPPQEPDPPFAGEAAGEGTVKRRRAFRGHAERPSMRMPPARRSRSYPLLAGLLVLSACSVGAPSGMTGPLPYEKLLPPTPQDHGGGTSDIGRARGDEISPGWLSKS